MAQTMDKPTSKREPIRVYADTSVYGGVFDKEFGVASAEFLRQVGNGRFRLIISSVVREEVRPAPPQVQALFRDCEELAEVVVVTESALQLQRGYLDAGIVGPQWNADALHVALATASRCALIVSWNFKHIVNYKRISLYNKVNVAMGHAPIGIYSPLEVIGDDGTSEKSV